MNLEDAINRKKSLGNFIRADKNNSVYKTLVVPMDPSERDTYLHWCKTNMIFDDRTLVEAEKPFSSTGWYAIIGILFNEDIIIDKLISPSDLGL